MRALQVRGTLLGKRALAARWFATSSSSGPLPMEANVEGYGEGATTLIKADSYHFAVDEPPKLGGKGLAPNPLNTFLGSLVGCTQYTASMIANEMRLGDIGSVAWSAAGEYDLRGVRGDTEGADARFKRISLQGTFDTQLSDADLSRLAEQMERRCIITATLKAAGLDMTTTFKKGSVDHECGPACMLHELTNKGASVTGEVKGQPGRDADAPHFAGQRAAHAYHTLARRTFMTSSAAQANGEDKARANMQADKTPQLQEETSEQGSDRTAGSAYSDRDDVRSNARPPVDGKSEQQIVKEQGAGATVTPQQAGKHAEGGGSMDPKASQAPSYAGRSMQSVKDGDSPLGSRPAGDE